MVTKMRYDILIETGDSSVIYFGVDYINTFAETVTLLRHTAGKKPEILYQKPVSEIDKMLIYVDKTDVDGLFDTAISMNDDVEKYFEELKRYK